MQAFWVANLLLNKQPGLLMVHRVLTPVFPDSLFMSCGPSLLLMFFSCQVRLVYIETVCKQPVEFSSYPVLLCFISSPHFGNVFVWLRLSIFAC